MAQVETVMAQTIADHKPDIVLAPEVEHIHHVANRRLVDRNVRVRIRQRVWQIVAASAGDRLQAQLASMNFSVDTWSA